MIATSQVTVSVLALWLAGRGPFETLRRPLSAHNATLAGTSLEVPASAPASTPAIAPGSAPAARRSLAEGAAPAAGMEVANKKEVEYKWIAMKNLKPEATPESSANASLWGASETAAAAEGRVRIFILAAGWDAARSANAHDICSALPASQCTVVDGVPARELTPDAVAAYEQKGLVTTGPLPHAPRWRPKLPGLLRVLQAEVSALKARPLKRRAVLRLSPATAVCRSTRRIS